MKTSKKIRGILIWLLVTILSVLAIYEVFGSPNLTPEMGMHRQEKMQMVGPSQVIWDGEIESYWYDRLMLGETEYGYCFYLYDAERFYWGNDRLTYVEKGKRECFHGLRSSTAMIGDTIPVFCLTNDPKAVRAQLTLETVCDENTKYSSSYTAQAELTAGTFYQFVVDATAMDETLREFWMNRLGNETRTFKEISGQTVLELYDRQGNLIDTVVTEYPAIQDEDG